MRTWQIRTETGALVGTFAGATPAQAVLAMRTGQASVQQEAPPVERLGRWSREHPVTTDLYYAGVAAAFVGLLAWSFRPKRRT